MEPKGGGHLNRGPSHFCRCHVLECRSCSPCRSNWVIRIADDGAYFGHSFATVFINCFSMCFHGFYKYVLKTQELVST